MSGDEGANGSELARQQISDALLSYCRGIDRLDPDALFAAFHPGANLVDFGPDPMTIETFAEHALASLEKRFSATQHRISNTAIAFDDTTAVVETYVLAFHLEPGSADGDGGDDGGEPATDLLHTFNGRYIDHFEQRDDRWRIATRTLRNDWSKIESVDQTMSGTWQASGRGGTPDPLYDARPNSKS